MGESNPLKRVALLPLAAVILAGCGGTRDESGKIAGQIGAASCTAEDYLIQNRLDGSKERIYSCELNGRPVCVAEEGGIASNVTAEVRILFANALGGSRPACDVP